MATINVQAGVAGHLLDRKPEQVRVALEAIRTASSEVLDELGAIVSVLRQAGTAGTAGAAGTAGTADSAAPRAPVAGLSRLSELVERARADGLPVELSVSGDSAQVAPTRSAAAYRVVQEALSNVRQHGGDGASATVRIAVGGGHAVTVEVIDDGGRQRVPSARTNGGLGLVGMRERVESTGGTLAVGPISPRGFRVEARWA